MEPSGSWGSKLWTLTAIWGALLRSHSPPPGLLSPVTPTSTGLVVCVSLVWLPFWVIVSDSSAGIQLRVLGPTPCLV